MAAQDQELQVVSPAESEHFPRFLARNLNSEPQLPKALKPCMCKAIGWPPGPFFAKPGQFATTLAELATEGFRFRNTMYAVQEGMEGRFQ